MAEREAIILGALLHDIGKFKQRGMEKGKSDHQHLGDKAFEEYFAERLSPLLSPEEKEIIRSAINNHHHHSDFITHADWISAGMERIELKDEEEYGDPTKERLQSVFEKISLGNNNKKEIEYTYPLKSLSFKRDDLFPINFLRQNLQEAYKNLWEHFINEVRNIPNFTIRAYMNSLYAILQKYTWCIPSAAYKHEPDISLFDHLKTTAAIAVCLYDTEKSGNKGDKKFLIAAGDISGIQNFIYRITKAQGMGGISKRLRGRSFYLLLLQEVIAKYLINNAKLFDTNILFCGGGRFELLLPNTESTKNILDNASKNINQWLFNEHNGELGIIIEWIETDENGLKTYSSLLEQLDEKLSIAKKKKFNTLFKEPSFWQEKGGNGNIRICKVCNINKVADDQKPCKLCELHKTIGEILPKTKYLIFASSPIGAISDNICSVPFSNFGTVYLVQQEALIKDTWLKSNEIDIYKINDLDCSESSFRFIGNTAPIAKESFTIGGNSLDEEDKKVNPGDVLSFEIIAKASIGDKRIGILKMDVDNLGLIFAIGLEGKLKSISRITSISRAVDVFFAGYINTICDETFNEWKNNRNNQWEYKDKINQIFYIVYSGGDDLLIIGPWSEIPKLAKKIRDEFKAYTCENPDLNISAGVFLSKPKYPISLAAKAAGGELEASKNKGGKKNKITLFGDTVEWVGTEDNLGFDELLNFGEELYDFIVGENLPRGFVHGLLRRHKQYTGGDNLNFIPAIIYQLSRNIKEDNLRDKLKEKLISDKRQFFKNIKIPASYALLKSRREV